MRKIEVANRMRFAEKIIEHEKNGYTVTWQGIGEVVMRKGKSSNGIVHIVIKRLDQ